MTPEELGDLTESLVPVAGELAFTVRTEGRDAISGWLDRHGLAEGATVTTATRALLVVLAARVDIDTTAQDHLAWVTWDERGEALDGTIPLLPVVPVPEPAPPRKPEPIGSPAARRRDYAALRARGMSVKEAAEELGVHPMTARRYQAWLEENGEDAA